MSLVLATYSGKDVNFSLTSPLTGTVQFSGISGTGLAAIRINMTTEQTTMQVAMDGSVVPSAVPGDQGIIEIEVWQTSSLQQQFLAWYNALKSARDAGDVENWAGSTIFVNSIVGNATHQASGVAPSKVPDKSYAEQAGRVTWRFMCANIVNQ